MPEIRVQPRSVYEHPVYVSNENTVLNWSFTTKKNSICFGLFYKAGEPLSQETAISKDDLIHDESIITAKRTMSLSKLSPLRMLNENGIIRRQSLTNNKTSSCDSDEEEDNHNPSTIDKRKKDPVVSTLPLDSLQNKLHEASPSSSIASSRTKRKSMPYNQSAMRMMDNGFVELIPIEQIDSSKKTIHGHYEALKTGNYVFLFDNKFSINTSKLLSFTVTMSEPVKEDLSSNYIRCGWLLKKKRKRLQGWAKRWFVLSSTGILTYSLGEDDIKRDSVDVLQSTLSISHKQRAFHLDSGTSIFHLKALSDEDFKEWIDSLKKIRVSDSKQTATVMWNNDISKDTADDSIPAGLEDMGHELSHLKHLLDELKGSLDTSLPESHGLITPIQSPTSIINRFSFKKPQSLPLTATSPPSSQPTSSSDILEKLILSANTLSDQNIKILNAYHEYQAKVNQQKTLLSTKSISALSQLQSDQFYDAEDFVLDQDDDSDVDFEEVESNVDEEEEEEENASEDAEGKDEEEREEIKECVDDKAVVVRRKRLPHPTSGYSISVIKILKKNIGKDLSKISLPVSLNEPTNMLQRQCEELEHSYLLDKAATECTTSLDRLMYVTTFAISAYSSSQYRIGRKPYNPVMNETYECVRPDKGFKFLSEKVSHHPMITACYAESKNYKFRQTNFVKSKFWGKTFELIPEGMSYIELPYHQEVYSFTKPSSWVRNILAGTKYMEHVGEMKVRNHATDEYAMVTFKEATGGGFFGSNVNERNRVVAKFYTKEGEQVREVVGKWSESLSEVTGPDQYSVIWRANPAGIPDYLDYYGYSQFAMQLNEITEVEEGHLPITDTRLRPDQSLLEHGKIDEADDEKARVEQQQRRRKKVLDSQDKKWESLWFKPTADPNAPLGQSWEYKGGYWEARETGEWPEEITKLW